MTEIIKSPIGFQIESSDGKHNIPPNIFYSWEIFSEKFVNHWIAYSQFPKDWIKVPIYEGDIEDYIFIQ